MRDFFIWCSGASVDIVKKCDDKEISKYTNIGIVIFCVALLSVVSATYFLSFAFNTSTTQFVWQYLPIGIIWGFIILSLDRAIVSTISKNDSWQFQTVKTIPRVALALTIGLIVATPLEFKIFEKEVENSLNTNVEGVLREDNKKKFNDKLDFWQTKVSDAQKKYESDKQIYQDEVHGKKSGIPGKGPRANEYMTNELASLKNFRTASDSLENVRKEIVIANQKMNWENEILMYKKNNVGVIERVNVLYALGNTHLAITFLFMLVELLPLLTKILSNKGAYDELAFLEETHSLELARLNNEKKSELESQLLSLENKKQTQSSSTKFEIEGNLQRGILLEIAKAQNQIALKRVKEFKQKNLANVNLPRTVNPVNKVKLEDIFWKEIETKTEFLFRNSMPENNEFRIYEDNLVRKGIWNYDPTKCEIVTEIAGDKTEFEITEVLPTRLKLKLKGTDYYLDFEKA